MAPWASGWVNHLGRELLGLLRQLPRYVVVFRVLERLVNRLDAQVARFAQQRFGLRHEPVLSVQVRGLGERRLERRLRLGQRVALTLQTQV